MQSPERRVGAYRSANWPRCCFNCLLVVWIKKINEAVPFIAARFDREDTEHGSQIIHIAHHAS